MTTQTGNTKSWIAGVLAAIAASLCCITPVLALLGGASGLAASFSWIEPYRPYLIGLTIAVFAFAWYKKLNPPKQADCDCEEDNKKTFWQSKLFLAIVTVVAALLIAFPYYAHIFFPKPPETKISVIDNSRMATVQLNISGMDCEACTLHINSELSKLNGVVEANTSYKKAIAIVRFDSTKTSLDSLTNKVNGIGYQVISSNIIHK